MQIFYLFFIVFKIQWVFYTTFYSAIWPKHTQVYVAIDYCIKQHSSSFHDLWLRTIIMHSFSPASQLSGSMLFCLANDYLSSALGLNNCSRCLHCSHSSNSNVFATCFHYQAVLNHFTLEAISDHRRLQYSSY